MQKDKKTKIKTKIELRNFKQILYVICDNDLRKEDCTIFITGSELNGFREYIPFEFEDLNIQQYYGSQKDVLTEIKERDFGGYSMVYVALVVNQGHIGRTRCFEKIKNIFYTIKKNKSLRFVTKILHCPFIIDSIITTYKDRFFDKRNKQNNGVESKEWFKSCENTVLVMGNPPKKILNKLSNDLKQKKRNQKIGKTPFIYPMDFQYNFENILYDLVEAQEEPIQLNDFPFYLSDRKSDNSLTIDSLVYISQKYHGNFIFAINPALSIFLNHINFPKGSQQEKRVGAEEDLERFKSTFDQMRIPQLIVQDGRKKDIVALMEKVATMNLSVLKYLFLTISSHGIKGDKILTRTGYYHVYDDIIKPLKSNLTLKNTLIIVLVNACRGKFDYQFSMEDETPPNFPKTDTENWDENLVLWFSTQKGCVSYRCNDGSVFLQQFLNKLNEIKQSKTINDLAQEIKEEMREKLKRIQQFPELLYNQKQEHTFRVILKSMLKYYWLLNQLENVVSELNF